MFKGIDVVRSGAERVKQQGGGGDGEDMEPRLTALETRLDTILPTLATKSDIGETRAAIAEAKSDIIKWLSGAVFAAIAILLSAMFFLAGRVAPPNSQAPAIVNNYPAPPAAPTK